MDVLKFGGTSMGSAQAIKQVIEIIKHHKSQDNNNKNVAVVVSAVAGVTNNLLKLAKNTANGISFEAEFNNIRSLHLLLANAVVGAQIASDASDDTYTKLCISQLVRLFISLEKTLKGLFYLQEISPRSLDTVSSFGERASSIILTNALQASGIEGINVDARKFVITNANFNNAQVLEEETNKRLKVLFTSIDDSTILVFPGFIGATTDGRATTLGRGGSDYSAALIAAGISANAVYIYTDVDGMLTADPRDVKNAISLPSVSYQEAMEMANFGAKVIYPPSLMPAFRQQMPVYIKNTFNYRHAGTVIESVPNRHKYLITGLSSITDISLVTIIGQGLQGIPGMAARGFGILAAAQINIILISQASSEQSICLALKPEDAEIAKKLLDAGFKQELESNTLNSIKLEQNLSVIAIVGDNMQDSIGLSGKIFSALGKDGINIIASAQGSSQRNISVVVSKSHRKRGLNSLHNAFFLADVKTLHLFLIGPGLIGKTLLQQIEKHASTLAQKNKLRIEVNGIINSKRMLWSDNESITSIQWDETGINSANNAGLATFIDKITAANFANVIVVDSTASGKVIPYYHDILSKSIGLVTPNKIANSGNYDDYLKLQATALAANTKFLFETNVGAGLPVISTLNSLLNSGDTIIKIEAVLSGTLSYIFNSYDGVRPFGEIVKQAADLGYTEPDPRDDLSGLDMARKLLILARLAGISANLEDVVIEELLPSECMDASAGEGFYQALAANEAHFASKLPSNKTEKLAFIGVIEDGKIAVKLQAVGLDNPFNSLQAADNMVAFTTRRYEERPLVIKGPGAGAAVTAAGIFAEIVEFGLSK